MGNLSPREEVTAASVEAGTGGNKLGGACTESTALLENGQKNINHWLKRVQESDDWSRLSSLFIPEFRRTTIIMLYITAITNFVYFGMIYGLPDTLKRAHQDDDEGWSP